MFSFYEFFLSCYRKLWSITLTVEDRDLDTGKDDEYLCQWEHIGLDWTGKPSKVNHHADRQ